VGEKFSAKFLAKGSSKSKVVSIGSVVDTGRLIGLIAQNKNCTHVPHLADDQAFWRSNQVWTIFFNRSLWKKECDL